MGSDGSDSISRTSLEEFLARAGIDIIDDPIDPVPVSELPPQPPQVQQQWQQPGEFGQLGQQAPQAVAVGGSSAMNPPYVEVPTPFLVPVNAQVSRRERVRHAPDEGSDSSAEKRKKRMIRNRESAARSRAKKEAYTSKLEAEVKKLEADVKKLEADVKSLRGEVGMLKKWKENLLRLASAPPPPEPKRKLRKTASAHF